MAYFSRHSLIGWVHVVLLYFAHVWTQVMTRTFSLNKMFSQRRVDDGNRKQKKLAKRHFEQRRRLKRSMPTHYMIAVRSSSKKVPGKKNFSIPIASGFARSDQTIAVSRSRCTFVWAGRFSSCPSSVLVNLHRQAVFQTFKSKAWFKWNVNIW